MFTSIVCRKNLQTMLQVSHDHDFPVNFIKIWLSIQKLVVFYHHIRLRNNCI